MTTVEVIALVLLSVALVEFVVWVIDPEILFSVADVMYKRSRLTQGIYLAGGGILLYFLLPYFSIVDIMAVSFFALMLMGMGMVPFGADILDLVRDKQRRGTLWRDFGPVWIVWLGLGAWTLYELFG